MKSCYILLFFAFGLLIPSYLLASSKAVMLKKLNELNTIKSNMLKKQKATKMLKLYFDNKIAESKKQQKTATKKPVTKKRAVNNAYNDLHIANAMTAIELRFINQEQLQTKNILKQAQKDKAITQKIQKQTSITKQAAKQKQSKAKLEKTKAINNHKNAELERIKAISNLKAAKDSKSVYLALINKLKQAENIKTATLDKLEGIDFSNIVKQKVKSQQPSSLNKPWPTRKKNNLLSSTLSERKKLLKNLYDSKEYLLFKKHTVKNSWSLAKFLLDIQTQSYDLWGRDGLISQTKMLNHQYFKTSSKLEAGTKLILPYIPSRESDQFLILIARPKGSDPLQKVKDQLKVIKKTESHTLQEGENVSNILYSKTENFFHLSKEDGIFTQAKKQNSHITDFLKLPKGTKIYVCIYPRY